MKEGREETAAEARRHVERMEEQSEKFLTGGGEKAADDDRIERLGRRIARLLGWLLAAFLLYHLVTTYVLR